MSLSMLLTPVLAADPASVQLKEVTVTATQDALAERHAAVAQKTVIDRQEIEALGGLTIGEVIGKLPGIDAGQHGGDGSPSANARGMGRDAVQILVDGERPAANSRYALTMVGRQPTGELEAATRARTLLDAHLVRRLTPALNLRLSAQNLLREDTRRASSAYSASDACYPPTNSTCSPTNSWKFPASPAAWRPCSGWWRP